MIIDSLHKRLMICSKSGATRDNIEAANRLEDAIYQACSFLAQGPLRGHAREDITKLPLRFWTVQDYPNYIIVYRPNTIPLQIIRVLHGSRNIVAILEQG